MTDRREQARAEAERRYPERLYPGGQRRFTEANLQSAFRQGWLAADANPQPHTITECELNEAAMAIADLLPARGAPAYVLIETALRTLGIEVEDDDA